MDFHAIERQARGGGSRFLRPRCGLGSEPDVAPAIVDVCRAVQRLHWSMCEDRKPVVRLQPEIGSGEDRGCVTFFDSDHSVSICGGFEIGHMLRRREPGVWAVIP